MVKRTAIRKPMPIPEGCAEVFEVFQALSGSWRGSKTMAFYEGDRASIALFVQDLNRNEYGGSFNSNGYCNHPDRYQWRHKAAIQINGKWHLVNINPFNVRQLPNEYQDQIVGEERPDVHPEESGGADANRSDDLRGEAVHQPAGLGEAEVGEGVQADTEGSGDPA